MPSLVELVEAHTDLDADDVSRLQLLLADWQIIADLSFADLVLWLPDRDGSGFWAGAQMRPTTAPTAFTDDVIGEFVPLGRRPLVDAAFRHGRLMRDGDPEWRDHVPVRVEAIPMLREDRVIAVIARNTNLLGIRTPSRLELSYLQAAADLTAMIASGHFPVHGHRGDHADSPRVGDGFVRIDAAGRVGYASPNALSVYRRLGLSGDLDGLVLAAVTRGLVPAANRDEEVLSAVLGGRVHRDTELGDDQLALIVRSIPLRPRGEHIGALVLLRDVTELRRRDRELVTKDATIREIHHRVKNNLQTVAALLRLQGRRLSDPTARDALAEAERRVGTIALVHETLSESGEEMVEFDEVLDRLASMVADVGSPAAAGMRVARDGMVGRLPSETATTLAMVLTELLQNAAEHAWPDGTQGTVHVSARRREDLEVVISDDGVGLPAGFDVTAGASLGLSIVRTLVESELGGSLAMSRGDRGGTRTTVVLPLR